MEKVTGMAPLTVIIVFSITCAPVDVSTGSATNESGSDSPSFLFLISSVANGCEGIYISFVAVVLPPL
ncbi:MAG: hypothetical protein GXZ01_11095 [Clostridiaceae bacterium]|nr:hypothetical protein [Clostridiaceae bacterium]